MNIKLENGHLKKKIEINLRIIKMYVIMIKYKNNKNKKIIILYELFLIIQIMFQIMEI